LDHEEQRAVVIERRSDQVYGTLVGAIVNAFQAGPYEPCPMSVDHALGRPGGPGAVDDIDWIVRVDLDSRWLVIQAGKAGIVGPAGRRESDGDAPVVDQ